MNYENLGTSELAEIFSDYHKDVHGFRPRYIDLNDRAELLHQLNRLDENINHRKTTFEGRESLRADGWVVETDPALIEKAAKSEQERDTRAMALHTEFN